MELVIRNTANQPIYEQIYSQIRAQIIAGTLRPGDALPSMRLLAKELRISIITTKRAYEELEREGYIESFTGKGSFVRGINRELVKESVVCKIEALFDEALDQAKLAGITKEELEQIFRSLCEEREY